MPTAEVGRSSSNQVRLCTAAQGPSAGFQEHHLFCAGKAILQGRVNILYSGGNTLHSPPGRMGRLEVQGLSPSAPSTPSLHLAKGVLLSWRQQGWGDTQDNDPPSPLLCQRLGDKAVGKLSHWVRPARAPRTAKQAPRRSSCLGNSWTNSAGCPWVPAMPGAPAP